MKKIKNIVTSCLLGLIVCASFSSDLAFATNGSSTVRTVVEENGNTETNSYDIPDIDMTDGKLDIGAIKQDKEEKGKVFSKVLTEYKGVVTFVSGVALISMILFFIINLIALGNSKGNPQERQKAITGLIVSGLATAGLGSVVTITQLFFHMVK